MRVQGNKYEDPAYRSTLGPPPPPAVTSERAPDFRKLDEDRVSTLKSSGEVVKPHFQLSQVPAVAR
jgi:hypothetical protein